MPNRILREGIVSSERVCSLAWAEEVFYRRLHSVVDDFGRFFAKPALLRAACYPLQLDKTSDSDIVKWLAASQGAGLVRVYSSGGKEYLELVDFRQQVRAKASKFPEPPADAEHPRSARTASAHLVGGGVVFEDEDEDVGVHGSRKNGAHQPRLDSSPVIQTLPLVKGGEFEVHQSLVAELEPLYPKVDVPATLNEMKGWLIGNPTRRKTRQGITRFITNWLHAEQQKAEAH